MMQSYGVPVDDPAGLMPWSWAEERLLANRNYWVTTVDADGRPHSMPVWGLWHAESERFWFSCAPDAFKARNLAGNPHVVVANQDTVEVVSIEGTASPHEAEQSIADAIGIKYESAEQTAADLSGFMMSQPMFQVTPVKAFGLIERADEFGPCATRWVW